MTSCIGISGHIRIVAVLKQIHVFDDLVWVLPYDVLPHDKKFFFDAPHQRDRPNAARCFWLCDNRSALLGISDIPGDVKRIILEIKILPLKAQAFATPDSGGRHQKHHAPIFWFAVPQCFEEDLRLILGEGIDGPLHGSGSIDFLDRVLFDVFLSLGIVEDNAENVIVVLYAFFAKPLAIRCPIFISEILKVSHDVDCRNVLETFISQLGKGYPHHKAIHRNR